MSKTLRRIIQAASCLPIILVMGYLIYVLFGGGLTETQSGAALLLTMFGLLGVAGSIGLEVYLSEE